MNDDLSAQFTDTNYITSYGVIRVGMPPPDGCQEVMNQVGCDSISILGAENPMGEQATDAENDDQHGKLGAALTLLGFPFVESLGQCDSWAERHFAVFGIPLNEALKLAGVYKQAAIVFCESGKPARLVWLEESQ